MITTVTLNAALDKSYLVDSLDVGKLNRVTEVIAVPGGKGINVAKVAKTLGASVTASGFLGGGNGEFVHRGLERLQIVSDFVWTEAPTRETVTVFDGRKGTITEFLEPGPVISAEAQNAMERKMRSLAGRSRVVSFSGSVPRGVSGDFYARLIRIAKREGALTILDASGDALSSGLEGVPDICKPNLEELSQWLGHRPTGANEIAAAARRLIGRGIRLVIVSMDKEGSVAVTDRSAWQVSAPEIRAVNTVGCGDALVAGLACHFDRQPFLADERQTEEALMLGTAAAASNALQRSAGEIRLEEVERFARAVNVTRLS